MTATPKNSFKKKAITLARETIMIVVGILLALEVSNLAENLKERKEEHQLLISFEKNLELDLIQLDSIENSSNRNLANVDTIIDILIEPAPERLARFIELQPGLLVKHYFVVNDGSFREASSTGKVELIENRELRKLIFRYYKLAAVTTIDEEIYETNTVTNLPKWIKLVGTSRDLIQDHMGRNVPGMPPLDLKELATNQDYMAILFSVKAGTGTQIKTWQERKERALELLSRVKKEIERWK